MDPSSEISAVAVRVATLTSTGAPDFGNALGGFALCGGISSLEYDYEVQEGAEVYEEDADGNSCVNLKRDDRIKRVTFTLTLCRSDIRMEALLLGNMASIVAAGQAGIGIVHKAGTGCGTGSTPRTGVSIELWNRRVDCSDYDTQYPYNRYVIPRAFVRPGAGTLDANPKAQVFEGYGIVNNNWGDGPFGDLDQAVGITNWPIGKFFDVQTPVCPATVTYVGIPGSAS